MGKRFTNTDYQITKTFLRMILAFLGAATGGAALVYGTPVLDALPAKFESWEQLAAVVVTAVAAAVLRGVRNWAKNSPSAPAILRSMFPPAAILVCAALASGCATTGSSLSESIFDPETGTTTTTNLKTKSMVTAWAEQQEGSGSASYEWGAEGGSLHVGQAAVGQKANLPLEQVLGAILPVLMNLSAPSVPEPNFRQQVLQFIRENPDVVSQAFYSEPDTVDE